MEQIYGTVIHWKGIWTQFGFPTANIFCDNKDLEAWTRRYNVVYKWQTYKALGPYFPKQQLLEIHLLDFQWDLYGKELTIYSLAFIRSNQNFSNTNELISQIEQDKKRVLSHPIKVITFGTFDKFHLWHETYLTQARNRGDTLITVIARNETVQKLKGHQPIQDEQSRLQYVQASWLAHHVVLWDKNNHYQIFHDEQPHIVCLGYDQHSFDQGIIQYCKKNKLRVPKIIRLDAYQPEKFKSSLI